MNRAADFHLVAVGFLKRLLVHVTPHQNGLVTGGRKPLRQGGIGNGPGRVAYHPTGGREETRKQCGARGDAGRAGRVGATKQRPFRRQLVQVRRADRRVPQKRQAISAHLVGHDEKNVRPGRRCRRSPGAGANQPRQQRQPKAESTPRRDDYISFHKRAA